MKNLPNDECHSNTKQLNSEFFYLILSFQLAKVTAKVEGESSTKKAESSTKTAESNTKASSSKAEAQKKSDGVCIYLLEESNIEKEESE